MFEKVLVPTDFSSYARKVQECMAALPGLQEIVLLHVLDASNPKELEGKGWSWDSLIDEAKTRLAEQAEHLSNQMDKEICIKQLLKVIVEPMTGADGVNLQRLRGGPGLDPVQGGSVGQAIIKAAAEEKVSLVCMGAQGKGLVEGMLLGSVSTEVLRQGESDLLIIRHKILKGENAERGICRDIFTKVMLTTDFSEAGDEAASRAEPLTNQGEILLVNVIEKENDFDEAASRLNRLRDDLTGPGRRVTVHVLEGRPADQILALAKKEHVSLIMMSSQGKSWSRQIRTGSTTFDVARRAECPVMVVRPGK